MVVRNGIQPAVPKALTRRMGVGNRPSGRTHIPQDRSTIDPLDSLFVTLYIHVV